jgi:cell division protease FtsH
MFVQYLYASMQQVANIPYSQFERLLRDGKVAEVGVSDRFIQGKLKEPVYGKNIFLTTRVDPQIAEDLQKHNVRYTGQIESTLSETSCRGFCRCSFSSASGPISAGAWRRG